MDKLKVWFAAHKVTATLIGVLGIVGVLGILGFQNFINKDSGPVEGVDLTFDAEGPYALLYPRRDGNALVLNLKRTASYDAITYELAYTSKVMEIRVAGNREEESATGSGSIDRGVQGTIDTKDKKGEYEQEILFGTCSQNVCKYDKGVENGTLTLHIRKGSKAYRMVTQWHLQKPDVALGNLTSGDGHFVYKINADRQALSNIGFSIINDLTGVPKLPEGKIVLGKVYALNVPIAKSLPGGNVSLELAENPPLGAKLARYDDSQNKWVEPEAALDGSKFTGKASGAGIFAVLIPKK
ncbi:MAG: Uncharacterized protein G01um10147_427 [Microgenomates group bacterium Gr01-1014_7]|nr:MAG: Uncharacterized protein G01um10147_427 [Microgenomates group bacterium Gr01-1014_7]